MRPSLRFGRLWVLDSDKQTIRYCALLDPTKWDAASGGGTIDMTSVWTQGMDEVTALAALGANLVIFGRNHIIQYVDGLGSEIGLDPTNMYVVDTVEGTGCIARDSVAAAGEGDLLYLSRHGVQSLGRVIQSKSSPVLALTKHVQSFLQDMVAAEDVNDIRAVHDPERKFYLLSLPACQTTLCIDTRVFFQDAEGSAVPRITYWRHATPVTGLVSTKLGALQMAFGGRIGHYAGTSDNGAAFTIGWQSGWLNPGETRLKMLKEIQSIVNLGAAGSISWQWQWDFSGDRFTKSVSYTRDNLSELAGVPRNGAAVPGHGQAVVQRKRFDGRGEGEYIRIGLSLPVSAGTFQLQQISLFGKIGRMT